MSGKWLERLEWIFNQIRPTHNEALLESDLSRQIKPNKINLIRHWDISSSNSIKFQQHKIRNYLSPNKKFVVSAEKIITDLRSNYDCIVGIHARRGDYATYLAGIHYHSWESYLNWGNETKKALEFSGKKNVGIVICSDEVPPTSITKRQSMHFSSSNEIMIDINLLSRCDYNLGPPSSFGTWVSWFGKVPRLVVHNNTEITSLGQFKVCTTC